MPPFEAARETRLLLNARFAAKLAPSSVFIDLNSAHGFSSSAALAANNYPKNKCLGIISSLSYPCQVASDPLEIQLRALF